MSSSGLDEPKRAGVVVVDFGRVHADDSEVKDSSYWLDCVEVDDRGGW
jgi:hypothetical protein